MAKLFPVELVSVEARVWSGLAQFLVARTTEGELGVLANHAPLLGQLKEPSRVRIRLEDATELAYDIDGGFLSVTNAGVTVLADGAHEAHGPDPATQATAGSPQGTGH